MTIGQAPLCLRCKWYKIPGPGGDLTCRAYPERIPLSIIQGQSHIEPLKGDNGFQYKALEGRDLSRRLRDLKNYTRA